MIEIDRTIVSLDLLEEKFACDLSVCEGACCIEGEAGAPLEEEELGVLDDIFEEVKSFMGSIGIREVELNGKWVVDVDGEFVTPLVKGNECVYVHFERGIAMCAIEQAYLAEKIEFRKPLSCHLYPVRITKYRDYDGVNYHKWEICKPACECGMKKKMKVHQFARDALIRKYGEKWYNELKKQKSYR